MSDFNIWLIVSLGLVGMGCLYTYVRGAFAVEIFNFVAFVCAIGYIILKRPSDGRWAIIPLIWLAGIMVSAVLLLLSQRREADKKK